MSDDKTIFDDDQNGGGETAPALTLPDNVKDLIGPGKKYATLELALQSLAPAQNHISTLEAELKAMREAAEKAVSLDQVYSTVQELLAEERKTHGTSTLDVSAVDGLLDRKLTARDAKKEADANIAKVKEVMREKFGEKAEEIYKTKATELGLGVEFLNSASAKSPLATLRLLGLEPQASGGVVSSKGSINTSALRNQEPKDSQRKPVMYGASMEDILKEVRRHDPRNKE